MTAEEILDLVNDKDEIIGEIERSKANSQKDLIHREIVILLLDKTNKILIQKRSKTKKIFPGVWILSVAGHVPKGAEPDKIAHEELKEELGFDTKLIFVDKQLMKYPNESNFAYFYLGNIPKATQYKLDPTETDEVKTINYDDYKKMTQIGEEFQEGSVYFLEKFWSGAYDEYINLI